MKANFGVQPSPKLNNILVLFLGVWGPLELTHVKRIKTSWGWAVPSSAKLKLPVSWKLTTELKKAGSTGSMLPEHSRLFPGTYETRTDQKGVLIVILYHFKQFSLLKGLHLWFSYWNALRILLYPLIVQLNWLNCSAFDQNIIRNSNDKLGLNWAKLSLNWNRDLL